MFKKIVKTFIKDSENVTDQRVRGDYGKLSGILGITLNLIMCTLKIVMGLITGAISIVSDGINNLSDAGSSLITLLGFKLSGKKPDKEHPFGHGRIEYFAGLIVSAIIIIVAFQLLKESIAKIVNMEVLDSKADLMFILTVSALIFSILIKLWMALFNNYLGKKINSVAMKATSLDSISDCVSTFVVLICTVLSLFFNSIPIDGIAGVVVSLFIGFTGVKSLFDVVNPLLGSAPDKDFIKEIGDFVTNYDKRVVGIHDLMLHDYGPGRKLLVLHVEVPAEDNIMELHDMIDNIEKALEDKFNVLATIHMDPVITTSDRVNELKAVCLKIVKEIDPDFNIHDFRMNEGDSHANIIFDVLLTHETKMSPKEVEKKISEKIKSVDKKFNAVIKAEFPLV